MDVVDMGDVQRMEASRRAGSPGRARHVVTIDRQKAALLGVNQAEAVQVLAAGLGGFDATFVHAGRETYPIPVRLELDVPAKADVGSVLALRVRSSSGAMVPLSAVVRTTETTAPARPSSRPAPTCCADGSC